MSPVGQVRVRPGGVLQTMADIRLRLGWSLIICFSKVDVDSIFRKVVIGF